MPKGKYTRKEAGIQSFLDVTGVKLPKVTTLAELREYVRELPEPKRSKCHQLYLQYMSIGRPDYLEKYYRDERALVKAPLPKGTC